MYRRKLTTLIAFLVILVIVPPILGLNAMYLMHEFENITSIVRIVGTAYFYGYLVFGLAVGMIGFIGIFFVLVYYLLYLLYGVVKR